MLRLLVSLALATFVSCDFDPELHAKYLSMEENEFVEYFNSLNYSYTIKNYDFEPVFSNVKHSIPEGVPVITYNKSALADLPDNFDSREKWSQCVTIGEILDQTENCGSCWAFAAATTASDRTCIHQGVTVRLSEQDFNCLSNDVCHGGYPNDAFNYYVNEGLVTQECKPYDIDFLKTHQCDKKCVNGADYAGDKHKGSSASQVDGQEDTIKAELFNYGPIDASFNAYEDLRKYTGGIYEHKWGVLKGGHSVRIIGYGVENGVPYWLVANSWGTIWGEQGFFRVKRFAQDLAFEQQLWTAMP